MQRTGKLNDQREPQNDTLEWRHKRAKIAQNKKELNTIKTKQKWGRDQPLDNSTSNPILPFLMPKWKAMNTMRGEGERKISNNCWKIERGEGIKRGH